MGQLQSQYGSVLRWLEDSRMAAANVTEIMTVVTPPSATSAQAGPAPMTVFAAMLAVGTVASVALVLAVDLIGRRRITKPTEVRSRLALQVLVVFPTMPEARGILGRGGAGGVDGSPLVQLSHDLRTRLDVFTDDNGPQTILVTAAQQGEGKTTILLGLALAFARAGSRTLVIEADLRRPQVATRLGLDPGEGLAELLAEDDPQIEDHLQSCSIDNLRVLTSGRSASNPLLALESSNMKNLMAQAREAADVVLVDSPPLLYGSDARVIARLADRVLLVIRSGKAGPGPLRQARDVLLWDGPRRLDVVLNGVRKDIEPYAYLPYYRQR